MKVNNLPITGTEDLYGLPLRKREFISRKLSDIVRSRGYEQLEVPLIERATSFSEDIVGESPWPEWNKRGCFYIKIPDYKESYSNLIQDTDALLIPEGTVSVSRWLGKLLDNNPNLRFPIKVFYNNLPCFRNELVDGLNSTKKRQFNQFGIEILGVSNMSADAEILRTCFAMLEGLGVKSDFVKARVSDVRIFSNLIKECDISHSDSILLKEAMDNLAECRAGKKQERKDEQEKMFWKVLGKYKLSENQNMCWKAICHHVSGEIDEKILQIFPEVYHKILIELKNIQEAFRNNHLNILIDLCVVRSHEYYTGLSFELDVDLGTHKYIEIAGGGRYDKLVGKFVNDQTFSRIPSTGFAFGIERVINMLESMSYFNGNKKIISEVAFMDSTADLLIVNSQKKDLLFDYFRAWNIAKSEIAQNKRCDIYVGDDHDQSSIVEYMSQNKIISKVDISEVLEHVK